MLVLLRLSRWQQSSFVAPASSGHISLPVVNVNKPLYPSMRWDFVVDEIK